MSSSTKSLTEGPLAKQILLVSLPLVLSNLLQVLFNMSDVAVVGRFAGSTALGSVGSTSIFVTLFTGFLIGLSNGINVLVARFYGARHASDVEKTVHSALLVSLAAGILLLLVGLLGSPALLHLLNTKEDLYPGAVLYLRVYFLGMPALALYNFGNAIFSAIGETKKPLYYLCIAGVLNILLNLFFVIVFHMGVAGVALATIISQAISAFLIILCLMKMDGPCHLDFKHLKFHPEQLKSMLRIGLPAGLQGAIFSISNVLIQSSVNSFGSQVMAGNTAAGNIEGFVYNSMNAVYQTSLSFTSQNMGAKKFDRINKILFQCLLVVTAIGLVMGGGAYLLGEPLLGIYTSSPEVVSYGLIRLKYVCATYFLCGLMDVMVGTIRGMGYSIMPMLVSLTGACAFRVIWIFTIFQMNRTLDCLYISYPISWVLTAGVHLICYFIVRKKAFARAAAQ